VSCISWSLFVLPLGSGFTLFLVIQLTNLGGCIDYASSGLDHILDDVRKVHQFQLVSLLLHCKPG